MLVSCVILSLLASSGPSDEFFDDSEFSVKNIFLHKYLKSGLDVNLNLVLL